MKTENQKAILNKYANQQYSKIVNSCNYAVNKIWKASIKLSEYIDDEKI